MSLLVLLTHHSNNQAITHQIGDFLISKGCEIYLTSEQVPNKVSQRAKLVQICDVFLVIANRDYQKSSSCLELLHYARDLKKKIFGINTDPSSFVPFGPLGAIIVGTQFGFLNLTSVDNIQQDLNPLLDAINKLPKPNDAKKMVDFRTPTPSVNLNFINESISVLISCHSDSIAIAKIVEEGVTNSGIACKIEDPASGNSSVSACTVLVVIMSPGYESNELARLIVEKAKSLNKPIIPISKTRSWKPEHWLGLLIAGILFFRIMDKEQAYKHKYDSCPMNDLVFEIKKAIAAKPSSDKIEKALIESLQKQIEECKPKLNSWPPKIKKQPPLIRKPVKVELKTPKADIAIHHTHYQVTRMELKPPPPVLDEHGRPLRKKFDCMISYNWDIQDLVREIYMDFNMHRIETWFDIWGFMEENSYASMATAVECSKLLVVFLTDKYQKSDNCALEFKYAAFCGKPFLFILNDPNLKLEPWIEPFVKDNPRFYVKNYDDLNVMENNVPKIDIIAQAIRAIGEAQQDYDVFDLSEEVVRLKELLNSALDEIEIQTGKTRFKICNRCKKQYDENNSNGCKTHIEYYLDGGTLFEAKWMCCQQQSKDSIGCRDAKHSDVERVWTLDSQYGSYTWEPH